MENAPEILGIILGTGTVGIVTVVVKALKDRAEGKTAREDTAIKRWQELASEHQRNAEKAWTIVAAYRKWYPRVLFAYVGATNDRDTFPTDPTQEDA